MKKEYLLFLLLLFLSPFRLIASDLLRAGSSRGEKVQESPGLSLQEVVRKHVSELGSSVAAPYRQQAKLRLKKLGSDILPYLAPALLDEDTEVSLGVLEVMAEIGDPQAAKFVLKALEVNDSVIFKIHAVKVLGKIKAIAAAPAVLRILKAAPENYFFEQDAFSIVESCLWSLGELGEARVVSSLVDFAKSYPKPHYLALLADALRKIGDPLAQPFLMELLKHRDSQVRWSAASALSVFAEPSMLAFLWEAFEVETDFEVRIAVSDLLAKIGGEKSIQRFVEMLRAGVGYQNQSVAERALKNIGTKALPSLIAVLESASSDLEQKVNCIRLIAAMGTAQANPQINRLAQDKNKIVQLAAIEALGTCGDRSSLNLLNRLSLSFNKSVRLAARQAREKLIEKFSTQRD